MEWAAIDWQFVGRQRGVCDLAYLLGLCLPPRSRRGMEAELKRVYIEGLSQHGVALQGYGTSQPRNPPSNPGLLTVLACSMLLVLVGGRGGGAGA